MIVPHFNASSTPNRTDIVSASRDASARTGSDFDYLLGTAMRESSLQADAKSKFSSATGLFQFIDQTWLGLVKRYGSQFGLDRYANAIQRNDNGQCTVASPKTKAAILALRQNPELSALMAGEAAKATKQSLECSLGRDVSCGELYAAHFLGQGGASKLIALNDSDPGQSAAQAFPEAAKANRAVFYHADGTAKSIGEVYAWSTALPVGRAAASPPAKTVPPPPSAAAGSSTATRAQFPEISSPTERRISQPPASVPAAAVYNGPVASGSTRYGMAMVTPSLPQPPLVLAPGVIEILAALGVTGPQSSNRNDAKETAGIAPAVDGG